MKKLLLIAAAVAASVSSFAWTMNKGPDLGPYWNPLGVGGTAIYTNSFIFNGAANDAILTKAGVTLMAQGAGGQNLGFFLMADSGNSPTATVLSSGTSFASTTSGSLVLLTVGMGAYTLTPGTRYWLAIQGQGNNNNTYQVGGHTQNSVNADNGTFWYSNSNSFSNYDGRNLTPEMAIYIETSPVPEPATLLAIGAGLAGFIARRRRK